MGLSLDTWVSIAALAAVAITLFGQARSTRAELKRDIAELRAELKGDIAELRAELKGDIAELRAELKADIRSVETRLGGDVKHLDDRVYALASGLKPEVERAVDGRRAGVRPSPTHT